MDIRPDSLLIQDLHVENIVSYLELAGWKRAGEASSRWMVFEGASDINGDPLQIVLPRNTSVRDLPSYVASAVNLLAALSDEQPEQMVEKISSFDRDILRIRNPETGQYHSVALKLAVQQIAQIKNLIAYSACSEGDPRPAFTQEMSIAKEMVEHYRFGQTFSGSFGYSIESHVLGKPIPYIQKALPLDTDDVSEIVILPLERRVMERIVRGLVSTQEATQQMSPQILIEQYTSGLNANMCKALVGLSSDKQVPLEYTIQWSPKLQPSADVSDVGVIRLDETSYDLLEAAEEALGQVQPEEVTIQGHVTGLSASDNPPGLDDMKRSVVIRWENRNGKPVRVFLSLDKAAYAVAHEAHIAWNFIEVRGTLHQSRNTFYLSDPQDFKVIG